MDKRAAGALPALTLAHVGDAVYELYVRAAMAGPCAAADLHRATVERVCAPSQAAAMERLLPALTEEETGIYRRGRNANLRHIPHGATAVEYARATGLEALFGWLYLTGQEARADALFRLTCEGDGKAADT